MIRRNKSHITIFSDSWISINFGVRKIFLIKSLPNITLRSVEYDEGK